MADPTLSLTGLWQLVAASIEFQDTGEKRQTGRPRGYLAVLPEGRMMVMVGSGKREMFAYSGAYHLEGDKWITEVEVASDEAMVGTRQVRVFTLAGDALTVTSEWRPAQRNSRRKLRRVLEWKRVRVQ